MASDLYTLGRTLAVLLMEFRFQSAYEFDLPPPAEQEVLARHDSLYRFLLKSTQRDPNFRFQSADEMADQLAGVLREVVAGTSPPKPVDSPLQGDAMAMHEELDRPSHKLLPDLKVRADNPGRPICLRLPERRRPPAGVDVARGDPAIACFQGTAAPFCACLDRAGILRQGRRDAGQVEKDDPFDWRWPGIAVIPCWPRAGRQPTWRSTRFTTNCPASRR